MARAQQLEFANFVCTFGDELELLDLVQPVIIPAFFDRQMRREVRTATYFIHRPQIVQLDDGPVPVMAIAGRFVKDTEITRKQIFNRETDEIEVAEQTLPNAPSALFVLILNDHKLIYLPETNDAPAVSTFGNTLKMFIRLKQEEFIREEHKRRKNLAETENTERVTLKSLKAEFPKADVTVIPLSGGTVAEEYLDRFAKLEFLHFKFITPNGEESNFDEFFEQVFGEKDELHADTADLGFRNRGDGLAKEKALDRITAALRNANTVVNMRGHDEQGRLIEGENEDVKIRIPFSLATMGVTNLISIARAMYERWKESRARGEVKIDVTARDEENLQEILQEVRRRSHELNRQNRPRTGQ